MISPIFVVFYYGFIIMIAIMTKKINKHIIIYRDKINILSFIEIKNHLRDKYVKFSPLLNILNFIIQIIPDCHSHRYHRCHYRHHNTIRLKDDYISQKRSLQV